jgi:N-acyl-D-aspartate/D-glutamate deacylase
MNSTLLSLIAVSSALVLSDVGTYEDPNHPAVGVQSVLVNGVPVLADGKLVSDAAPGRPIRRLP